MYENGEMLEHIPFCISESDSLVLAIKQSMKQTTKDGEIFAFPAWSDAGFIANYSESKCVVMGPGNLGVAHSKEEFIAIKDIEEAAYIYGITALNFCR